MNLSLLALTLPLTFAGNPVDPPPIASPFLYVKVLPPAGSKVVVYPGTATGTVLKEPKTFGLRPGYSYRMELSDLPGQGKEAVFPSLEVFGTLQLPRQVDPAKHPVPIVLSEEDITKALEGRFLSKVFYLEDPDMAEAITTEPDQLLEYPAPTEKDAIKQAREKGRLVMILRMGERHFPPDELIKDNVPGTIWFPGQPITIPARPPCLPYGNVQLFDPRLGPKISTAECLHDGGDEKERLGIGFNNKLYGLDPSDTSIEYSTPKGRKVESSNRVCICVPRFAAMRSELSASGYVLYNGPSMNLHRTPQLAMSSKNKVRNVANNEELRGYNTQSRVGSMQRDITVADVNAFSGIPMGMAQLKGTKVVAEIRSPEDITSFPCKKPLILQKWADPAVPEKIGDIVTFYLRYNNTGQSTMTDVVISDSLTARLEYIEGSAKSDRAATLTVTPNEVGSVTLRWSIDSSLKPGENGQISFKAKIR